MPDVTSGGSPTNWRSARLRAAPNFAYPKIQSAVRCSSPHVAVAPRSAVAHRESVDVATMDEAMPLPNGTRLWLKLDTQGSEDRVLAGAQLTLTHVEVLQTELSIVECYSGQADYRDVLRVVHDAGLRLVYVEPGTQDLETGELLQFDGLFARPGRR
jgi:hypothetical protein